MHASHCDKLQVPLKTSPPKQMVSRSIIVRLIYSSGLSNKKSAMFREHCEWAFRSLDAGTVSQFIQMKGRNNMKIVVIGGSGLIGSKVVQKLGAHGHQAVAASPDSGVNTVTGEGLAEALKGASVVVDVSNSPSWEDSAVLKFFETSTRNLITYEAAAGVKHHVALSVVGTDRLSESGYFRAKIAQEKLIKESSIPNSIVHATQFFEFLKGLADISIEGGKVHLPPVLFQPMAADDVASGVVRVAVGPAVNGIVEIGGPEQFRVDELVRRRLASLGDEREVIADPHARYAGAELGERTLLPGKDARLGETRFADWLKSPASQPPATKLSSAAAGSATKGA
jgi:uncharacterized protein YbjT (DUF2867 family)